MSLGGHLPLYRFGLCCTQVRQARPRYRQSAASLFAMADNEEAKVDRKVYMPTRRGGKSWQRKMRREERIRKELKAQADKEAQECLNLPFQRMSDADQRALLQEWQKGNLQIPDEETFDPERREDEPSAEAVKEGEDALSSPTEMPIPTEWPSPTSPTEVVSDEDKATPKPAQPAEQHMGAPAEPKGEPQRDVHASSSSSSTALQPLIPPKELEEKPKALTPVVKPKPTPKPPTAKPPPPPRRKTDDESKVPTPVEPVKRQWPCPGASESSPPEARIAVKKALSGGPPPRPVVTANPPSYSRLHTANNRHHVPPVEAIAISDLHKVLDTDRGHIRRAFGADCRNCWRKGIKVEIISYIGRDNTALRSDAEEKVADFNRFLAQQCPEFVGSEYLPIPFWISDYRTCNGGKLSLIQQYYQQDEGAPPVIAVIDDSPDVCYEVDSGNIRSYRIFGGRKPWQRHESHQPVFRNFSEAVDIMLGDYEAGAIPYRPVPDRGSEAMIFKKGVYQIPGR